MEEIPENLYWKVVRDKSSFCDADFKNIKYISLDHDLGIDDFTGYDAVKFLCEYLMVNVKPEDMNITLVSHSMNPIGKKNIECYWDNFLKVYYRELTN